MYGKRELARRNMPGSQIFVSGMVYHYMNCSHKIEKYIVKLSWKLLTPKLSMVQKVEDLQLFAGKCLSQVAVIFS